MPLRLSNDQVNLYLLSKQHLTPKATIPDPYAVVQQAGPLRANPSNAPYLSLWSRIAGFRREMLEHALYEQRSLVRVPGLHARLCIIPSHRYPAYYQTTRAILEQGTRSLADDLIARRAESEPQRQTEQALVQRVLEVLSTRGPYTAEELGGFLPALNERVANDPDRPEAGSTRLASRLIPAMCAQGLLVMTRPRGSWRSELYTYVSLSSWLPDLDLESVTPEEGLRQVVLDYVTAYGPVTVGDILHWLGVVRRQSVVSALMALRRDLVRLEIGDSRGDYYMLESQLPALRDLALEERSVCMVPPNDNLLLAYSDTQRFLPARYRERVFDRAGEPLGTIWLDGQVVGVWWAQIRDERIRARFFEPVDVEAMALVAEEARQLSRFIESASPDIQVGLYLEEEAEEARLLSALPQRRDAAASATRR